MENNTTHEADKRLGANIAERRALAGFSQVHLGKEMNPKVSAQQISKFEHGVNRVCATQVVDIARALGCRVADLFEGVDTIIAEGGGFAEEPQITKREGKLLRDYRKLRNPELQKLVTVLVHALITETANNMRA